MEAKNEKRKAKWGIKIGKRKGERSQRGLKASKRGPKKGKWGQQRPKTANRGPKTASGAFRSWHGQGF